MKPALHEFAIGLRYEAGSIRPKEKINKD